MTYVYASPSCDRSPMPTQNWVCWEHLSPAQAEGGPPEENAPRLKVQVFPPPQIKNRLAWGTLLPSAGGGKKRDGLILITTRIRYLWLC